MNEKEPMPQGDAPNAPGLYAEMVAAGVPIANHYSDLYVPINEVTRAILERHPLQKSNATTFRSNINGERMYDIPFAYQPYWDAKNRRPERKAFDEAARDASRAHAEKDDPASIPSMP